MPRFAPGLAVTVLLADRAAGQWRKGNADDWNKGGFGNGFGGGGYNPPAPICPAFKCAAGEKAVAKTDHQVWSYGCKESGMNVFSAASLDPNNPFAGMQNQKNVDKCCVERDICKQTCGMTSKACHDAFQKCSQKICKGDQNCQLQAMMSEIMSEPYDPESKRDDYKYDPEESKCRGYKKGQAEACTCVPEEDFKSATEEKLKSFYGKYNPKKLDDSGEIKDVDEVWKKWKGKEPEMFMALTTKYKAKAVTIKTKPKPPPYTPPKKDEEATDAGGGGAGGGAEAEVASAKVLDADDTAFEEKLSALQEKKKQAASDEDYDLADKAKEQLAELKSEEAARLKANKAKAIGEEDYPEAKRIKQRIARLEEL